MFNKTISAALRSLLLASVLGLSVMSPCQAQTSTIRFETLSVEEGLSQSTVWAIFQDRQGYMWFGTDDGLNKYDGYAFTVYKHDPDNPTSLIDSTVKTIFEDSTGTLWFGTPNGLDRFDRENERFIHYTPDAANPRSLSGSSINVIVEDKAGSLWVGSMDGGLSQYDRTSDSFTRYVHDADKGNSIAHNSVYDLYIDEDDTIWIATGAGLDRLTPATGSFYHYVSQTYNPYTLSNNLVRVIVPDGAGKLWIGTENGLNRLNPKTGTFIRHLPDPARNNRLSSGQISDLHIDSQNELWIGGRNGVDLLRLGTDRKHFVHYSHNPNDPHSLSNDSVCSLYEDRSGTIWVGTYGGGLSRYNRTSQKFALYQHIPNQPNSLNDNVVYSLFQDHDGMLWVGTMDGGLNRVDRRSGEWTAFVNDPGDPTSLSDNEVRAIFEDHFGILWVGTASGGLNRLEPTTGSFIHYQSEIEDPNSLSDNFVRVIFEDSTGNLWIGTRSGGLNLFDRQRGSFKHYLAEASDPHSLSNNDIRAIFEDGSGNLWVGTVGGLNLFNPANGRFERFTHDPADPNSLSSNHILSIYQDVEGKMWIGTLLGGLNSLDRRANKIEYYSEKDGLPNATIYGILGDSRGNLWLSSNKGLTKFNPHSKVFRNYDTFDGLQSNEFAGGAYHEGWSGEFFFGGIKGFNAFDPNQVRDNPSPPPVVIKSFKKFNQVFATEIAPEETIQLSYQENFISFEFAALDFTAPEKNQYAYKLDGFDQAWVNAGTRNYASYTNLRGGRYKFHVIASNNDGVWNETGTSVSIVVVPPFWESWWFITLITLGVVGVIWGGYQMRLKRIQTQTWILEKQVQERTQEVERRREVAEGLREIISLLNSDRSLDDSLAHIISQVVRLMHPQSALIFRQIPGCGPKITAGCLPVGEQHDAPARPAPELPAWITTSILAGESLVIPDVLHHLVSPYYADRPGFPAHGAILGVPLLLNEEIDGGLVLFYDQRRNFSDDDCATLITFAEHAALAIANADLRAQAEEIAIHAERSRLARDLHDAVTQTLFATSLISEVLPRIWDKNPDEGKKKIMEIRELTRGALAEMRTLLMELRPTALMDVPLSDLLQQLGEAFTGRARVPVTFTANERCPLTAEVQTGFYRIAQEALNNIAKHAHASLVEIALTVTSTQVSLWIKDNGCGFDPCQISSEHLGLQIMTERAQAMNARISLNTQPGLGTQIRVVWDKPAAL